MVFYFIRHGEKETTSVVNSKIHHTDPSLTKRGFEQAQSLVKYFAGIHIDEIYSSEYLRVQQTAKPLAQNRDKPIIVDKRLNEIDNGIIETMADDEIERQFPEFWKDFWDHKKDCRFPGGETGEEVKERQNGIMNEQMREDKTIVFFTHDGFIRILICNILGMPVYHRYKFKCDYCGITELTHEKEGWKIQMINHITY
jgi:broad specificity phosphatase PhoE